MSETLLERHYRDRMRSVTQAVREAAQVALPDPDFDDLVVLCLGLADSWGEFLEMEYKRIFKEPHLTVAWLRERRRIIEELSDHYLQLAGSIRDVALRVVPPVDSHSGQPFVTRLEDAIQLVTQAKQQTLERWPVGTDEEIAAIREGDTMDLTEAFADIAGVDVGTWQKQVEEYKRSRRPAGA